MGFSSACNCEHLVVGCREEVWSELEPELEKAGLAAMIAGRFHLASFDLTAAAILQAARPVFDEWQHGRYAGVLAERFTNSRLTVRSVLRPVLQDPGIRPSAKALSGEHSRHRTICLCGLQYMVEQGRERVSRVR